ncbi:MAG: nitroreductase family protein [Synergistaceae bacterium]|nr:nitroreductase family protein [Synergistaceae bacterium]
MNETLNSILGRRSIRKFTDKAVSEDCKKLLLKAAFAAPSAKNQRGTDFVVVEDRKILDTLADNLQYGKMLYQAPLCIAVCSETKRGAEELVLWEEDASAAIENILVAAKSLGLGSVWLGILAREDRENKVREILEVPSEIRIVGIAAIGYPDEEKEPHGEINEARVHFNKW